MAFRIINARKHGIKSCNNRKFNKKKYKRRKFPTRVSKLVKEFENKKLMA